MKIYVSCPSKDWQKAREIILYINNFDYDITDDWTTDIKAGEDSFTPATLKKRTEEVISAVTEAEVVVLVVTKNLVTTGCAIEVGAALSHNIQIIVLDPENQFNHFFSYHRLFKKVKNFELVMLELDKFKENKQVNK